MELDYDFVRDLLIFCAESKHKFGPTNKETIEFSKSKNIPMNQLAFTVNKLFEAGFTTHEVEYASNKPKRVMPGNLTWEGNEYLNSIKNKSTWNNIKKLISEKGLSISFDVIKDAAKACVKNSLGL